MRGEGSLVGPWAVREIIPDVQGFRTMTGQVEFLRVYRRVERLQLDESALQRAAGGDEPAWLSFEQGSGERSGKRFFEILMHPRAPPLRPARNGTKNPGPARARVFQNSRPFSALFYVARKPVGSNHHDRLRLASQGCRLSTKINSST